MHMTVNIDRYIEDMEQWKKTREENEKLRQELQRKDNIINELKKIIDYYGTDKEHNDNVVVRHILKEMLDIIKELENGNK